MPDHGEEPIKLIAQTSTVDAVRVDGGIAEVLDSDGSMVIKTVVFLHVEARVSGHTNEIDVDLFWTADQARLIAQRLIESAFVAEREAQRGGA